MFYLWHDINQILVDYYFLFLSFARCLLLFCKNNAFSYSTNLDLTIYVIAKSRMFLYTVLCWMRAEILLNAAFLTAKVKVGRHDYFNSLLCSRWKVYKVCVLFCSDMMWAVDVLWVPTEAQFVMADIKVVSDSIVGWIMVFLLLDIL